MSNEPVEFLRIRAVEALTSYKKSQIYKMIGERKFPRPVRLGEAPNSPSVWPKSAIVAWQQARIEGKSFDPGTELSAA